MNRLAPALLLFVSLAACDGGFHDQGHLPTTPVSTMPDTSPPDAPGCAATTTCNCLRASGTRSETAAECPNPPAPSAAPAPATYPEAPLRQLALTGVDLGDASDDAWRAIGMDLDGQSCDVNLKSHCRSAATTCEDAFGFLEQGKDGIDNSFARAVVPVLSGFAAGPSRVAQDAVDAGIGTHLLRLEGVPASGDATSVSVLWEIGADRGVDPSGTATWHPSARQGAVAFTSGFVSGDVLVARTESVLTFRVLPQFQGGPVDVHLHHARLSLQLSKDRASVTRGILAGVLLRDELKVDAGEVLRRSSKSFCGAGALATPLVFVDDAADIGADGAQDPERTCDGISFGVTFQAVPAVALDPADETVPADPCAD